MDLNNTKLDLGNNIINQLKNFQQKFKIIQKEYITTAEMNILDNNCEYYGISKRMLMENAGIQAYNEVINHEKQVENTTYAEIYLFCGKGNNGGDGFVLARHLSNPHRVNVVLLNDEDEIKTQESKENFDIINNIYKFGNINIYNLKKDFEQLFLNISYKLDTIANEDECKKKILFVDAMLGTGISGNLRYPYDKCIESLNLLKNNVNYNNYIDIISLDTETKGLISDKIITFHNYKDEYNEDNFNNLNSSEKSNNKNKTILKEIGIPDYINYLIGIGELKSLSKTETDSHKGNNGRTLVIGGSKDYYGAPIFSAVAASKIVDVVTVATVSPVAMALKNYPELMIKEFKGEYFNKHHVEELASISKNYDSIVLGCGIGLNPNTKEFLEKYLNKILSEKESMPKLIIDADAIKLINPLDSDDLNKNLNEKNKELYIKLFTDKNIIFTPHKGEFEYIKPILKELSDIYQSNIVLKGKIDIVFNKNNIKLNMTGNAGMTIGGTGDILAGLIAGFSAKNDPYVSACAGVFINGLAGDYLNKQIGYNYNSRDILNVMPKILHNYLDF
ncbi:NAD(P)H-hydrate dehydratase [Methanococcus voltae]|uniref:NAD(P)H-hydrate dehydratase n=1 Tax=Methanococcus voltae TaxID=2188 RepID=UPI001AE79A67|nr:NAD(P)H-hydrate dehydratase [Methanococcus voltae]MBP2172263.1 NAD(P)H-hydrate epimerase [Methanococcus voltae]